MEELYDWIMVVEQQQVIVVFFFFFVIVPGFGWMIFVIPSPVLKSICSPVSFERKTYCSCCGDSGFWINVLDDGRWDARTSCASKAICCLGERCDEPRLIIGVDVQTGTVLDERIGEGVCREQLT